DYQGYDASEAMIAEARKLHPGEASAFHGARAGLSPADCTVASGIFNVKLEAPPDEWKDDILRTVHEMASLSTKGFSFNMLTSYSDRDRMRPDLFYGDPSFFFDYCKRTFSRN